MARRNSVADEFDLNFEGVGAAEDWGTYSDNKSKGPIGINC